MFDVSPLAPDNFPNLPSVKGVRLATMAAGLRYSERDDLMLAVFPPGSTAVGTLTKSLCPSAPVDWCRKVLAGGRARALVVNAGNANAFSGIAGWRAVERTAKTLGAELGVEPEKILVASTGVVGEPLQEDTVAKNMPDLVGALAPPSASGWQACAKAITTTDTFSKGSAAAVELDGTKIAVAGFAKGSGMIAPDMATMLSFVFTDIAIEPRVAERMLSQSVDLSYNRITVDSDTSTSDTVLFIATGEADVPPVLALDDPRVTELQVALDEVNLDLAHQIIKDGEGATKFVSVNVAGAASDSSAATIARSIADSPLVKTAVGAEDANWGRIVMAVGKAGQPADRDQLAIWIGDEQCARAGVVCPGYSESRANKHLSQPEVSITVDVGVGEGCATIWTCDLTHGYIEINAEYRT